MAAEAGKAERGVDRRLALVKLDVPLPQRLGRAGHHRGHVPPRSKRDHLTRPRRRACHAVPAGAAGRRVALHRRDTAELLAEELRRLDPDEVYAESLAPFALRAGAAGPPTPALCLSTPEVIVHAIGRLLAKAAAARAGHRLVDAEAAAGARISCSPAAASGPPVLGELAAAPARDAVDWHHLDIWWGDERFLPDRHPERNEAGARADAARPGRRRPGAGAPDARPRRAGRQRSGGGRRPVRRRAFARRTEPEDHGPVPAFDILMLGIGPEGHVASLFPGGACSCTTIDPVVAVRGSPKPPPIRISLTLPRRSRPRRRWGSWPPARRSPARSPWLCPAPVQAQPPGPRAAGSARCTCSTRQRRRSCPPPRIPVW